MIVIFAFGAFLAAALVIGIPVWVWRTRDKVTGAHAAGRNFRPAAATRLVLDVQKPMYEPLPVPCRPRELVRQATWTPSDIKAALAPHVYELLAHASHTDTAVRKPLLPVIASKLDYFDYAETWLDRRFAGIKARALEAAGIAGAG